MKLSKEEMDSLRSYRNRPDEDDIRYKEIIKTKLLENNKIIYLLNNKELQDSGAENDEYFGINILPMYMITETQHNVQNYLCYETSFDEVARYNSAIKIQQIIFYILCEQKNIIVQNLYVARHDLIAAELINMFQGCNYFGNQLKLISSKPSVTDNSYATRTLIFEQQAPNSLTKGGKSFNLRS